MELQDPSLELGLEGLLDDEVINEVYGSPFSTDSEYSLVSPDGSKNCTLFSDASLYDISGLHQAVSINEGIVEKRQVSPAVDDNSLKTSISALSESSLDDITNHHDYAQKGSNLPKTSRNSTTKIDVSKILNLSKLISCSQSDKKVAAVTFKISTPSSPEEESTKDPVVAMTNPPMTKNAIAARENRLKKKQDIQTLESSVQELKSENKNLKFQVSDMSSSIEDMSNELEYLRSVLSNVDEISSMVKGIKSLPNFQSSKASLKRSHQEDSVETVIPKFPRNAKSCSLPFKAFSGSTESREGKPGICVHIRGSSVSLELCHSCSKKASASFS